MMEVTFLRLNWVKGRRLSKSDICNGVIPVNAVETEDGTGYLIPANLYLTVRAANGSVYNWDIRVRPKYNGVAAIIRTSLRSTTRGFQTAKNLKVR